MNFFTFSWGKNYLAVRGLLKVLGHTLSDPGELTDSVITKGIAESDSFLCYSGKAVVGQLINQLDKGERNLEFLSSREIEACRCADTGGYFHCLAEGRYPGFRAFRLGGNSRQESLAVMRQSFPGITERQHDKAFRVYYWKLGVLDLLARESLKFRCLAADPKEVARLEQEFHEKVDRRQHPAALWWTGFRFCVRLNGLKKRKEKPRLRIGIVGGEHILSELDSVMARIKNLADKGIFLEWRSGFYAINRLANRENPPKGKDNLAYLTKRASHYLNPEESGTEILSCARALEFADEGFDGLIHIYAFGCLPQTSVKPALQKISTECRIPLLSLSLGDRFDAVSLETRMEAFIDILGEKQNENRKR